MPDELVVGPLECPPAGFIATAIAGRRLETRAHETGLVQRHALDPIGRLAMLASHLLIERR